MSFHIAIGPRVRKSPYFDRTVEDGVTHFSIYNRMLLPLYYGAPDAEYRRLIEGVAMWDVAAQRQIEITGPDAERLVRYLTPRDLKDCDIGRGYYVPLCDHHGSLINDPILLAITNFRRGGRKSIPHESRLDYNCACLLYATDGLGNCLIAGPIWGTNVGA